MPFLSSLKTLAMEFLHYSFVIIYFCLIITVKCYEEEETKNACVAHSVPVDTLELIMQSSIKVLSIDTDGLKKNLQDIQEHVIIMKESLSALSDTSSNESMNKSLSDILKYQKSFSEMLNSVFNTVLNNNNVIEELNGAYATNFMKLGEKIAELALVAEEKSATLPIDEINTETLNITSPEDQEIKPETNVDMDELLKNQNETNRLLTSLLEDTRETKQLQQELFKISNENQSLKKKLQKYKGSIRPSDCNDIFVSGIKTSGVYEIYPSRCDCSPPVKVWCDMDTNGGGWTILLPRIQAKKFENFTKPWFFYEHGFGNPENEYWIGLQNLHELTTHRRFSLRLEVTSRSNRHKWGQWNNFEVGSSNEKYKLTVGGFDLSSTLGDVFRTHHNQQFSTFDSDNDSSYEKNCANLLLGGWWYGKCYDIHPTGNFDASDIRMSVSTSLFTYSEKTLVPLKKLILKIKPLECIQSSSVAPKSCDN